jgi:hypothetical protein
MRQPCHCSPVLEPVRREHDQAEVARAVERGQLADHPPGDGQRARTGTADAERSHVQEGDGHRHVTEHVWRRRGGRRIAPGLDHGQPGRQVGQAEPKEQRI